MDLEDKFRALEIDDELQKLKEQLRSHQTGERTSQSNKTYTQPKNDQNSRCYEILELKPDVSLNEVKQAYRNLVKKWHPDLFFHNPQLQKKAQEKLREINKAYEKLCSKN